MEILNLKKKKKFPNVPSDVLMTGYDVAFELLRAFWPRLGNHLASATHRVDCGYLSSSCFPAIERKRAHDVNMYPRRYITQRNNSSQHLAWLTKKKLAVQGLGWFSSQGPAGYLRCWGWLLFSESSTNRKKEEDEYVIICTRKLSWGEAAL